jgi:prepilin-type N-terminal cleavage/methylation domain-containing protein
VLKNGFTLIELLVVMSVTVLLITVGIARFNDYNNTQLVKQAAFTFRNNMRLAQAKALSSEKPSTCAGMTLDGYGIGFPSSSSYTIRPRCNNAARDPILTYTLPAGVTFSSSTAFYFRVLNRGSSLSSATNYVITGFGKTETVTVSPSGDIKYP